MQSLLLLQKLALLVLACGYSIAGRAQTTCPAVTNLAVTTTLTTATVTATLAPGAASYIIVCQVYPVGNTGITFNSVTATTPQYTFTGMSSNMQYTICVYTVCANTTTQGSACGPRFNPVLSSRNPTLAAQVTVHPNPAHGAVTLTIPARLQGGEVLVSSALGQVVRRQGLPAHSQTQLDIAGLAPGIYSLHLQAKGETVTKRLVIQ